MQSSPIQPNTGVGKMASSGSQGSGVGTQEGVVLFDELGANRLEAQAELADLLIHMKMSGKLSARDVCILMHWAVKVGLPAGPA
eukprot:10284332-Lingulodinium_polyedra.AAC.1